MSRLRAGPANRFTPFGIFASFQQSKRVGVPRRSDGGITPLSIKTETALWLLRAVACTHSNGSATAKARGAEIHGELVGYAMNTDATDFVLPNPERQAQCVNMALKRAGLEADQIDIVSTHATGTMSGDSQECSGPSSRVR